MVRPGQFLERAVVVRSGEIALDGLYHRGRVAPPCVLAPPHPALGGSMVAPVIAELAWALTRAGHATLRFDYRGVGASQGVNRRALEGDARIGDVAEEVGDFFAATDQLLVTARAPAACAIGYSFGAAVALAAHADSRVQKLVLIAPPNALGDFSALAQVQKPLLVVCAHHDARCDRSRLALPSHALLEVIPHSDAAFLRGLPELGRSVAAWVSGGTARPVAAGQGDEAVAPARELTLEESDGPPLELDLPDGLD